MTYYRSVIAILMIGALICILIIYVNESEEETKTNPAIECVELIGQGLYDEALDKCNEAIDDDPDVADSYINRAAIRIETGQYDAAIADCARAIGIDPEMEHAYSNRGLALTHKGLYDLAIEDYSKAIELNPDFVAAYGYMGWTYYLEGKYDLAIETSKAGLAIDPEQAWIQYNLGLMHLAAGDYEQAEDDYAAAVETTTSLAIFETAIDELKHLITSNPDLEEEATQILQMLEASKSQLPY